MALCQSRVTWGCTVRALSQPGLYQNQIDNFTTIRAQLKLAGNIDSKLAFLVQLYNFMHWPSFYFHGCRARVNGNAPAPDAFVLAAHDNFRGRKAQQLCTGQQSAQNLSDVWWSYP
jgi:hypothetical protein